ncbi:MAG: Verru_Chthon cassette protein B [Verrucomicrobiota bacterium]
MSSIRTKAPRNRGFSLVETVIAVAIVATVMISLLAMLPVGLDSLSEAKKTDIQARIMQTIVSEVQMTGWKLNEGFEANLATKFPSQVRYYDDEGNELETDDHRLRIYTARVRMLPSGFQLPGEAAHIKNLPVNPFLRTLLVEITSIPGVDTSFFDDPLNSGRFLVMTQTVVSTEPIEEDTTT